MKKVIINMFAVILFMIGLIKQLSVKGDEIFIYSEGIGEFENTDVMYLNNNFSTKYFYNLNNYCGNNSKGSCGYVALSMILSFYDTYWDDRVIPENYDQNANFQTVASFESPGIRKKC